MLSRVPLSLAVPKLLGQHSTLYLCSCSPRSRLSPSQGNRDSISLFIYGAVPLSRLSPLRGSAFGDSTSPRGVYAPIRD